MRGVGCSRESCGIDRKTCRHLCVDAAREAEVRKRLPGKLFLWEGLRPVGYCIEHIAYVLPGTVVSNEDLQGEHPDWDMKRLGQRTGVRRRYIAAPEQTALDLGVQACEELFKARPEARDKVDAIVFCTESADYVLPPNACVLHGKLNLAEHVLAFDVDLGCSGYPYCLGLARGMLISGMASNVLLVNADTYSKVMDEGDQSCRVLFGDGAAVSWIAISETAEGITDVECCTAGQFYEKFIIPGGGFRDRRALPEGSAERGTSEQRRRRDAIHMDGKSILAFAGTRIPTHVRGFLKRNGLQVDDIDLFVFHQASQMVLDTLQRLLRIQPERMYVNLADGGNMVSASIPVALKQASDAGRLSAGDKVVVCGFGLGLSWASALLEWK